MESAPNSWGLPTEDLLHNVTRQVNEDAKGLLQMPWPPSITNLCAEAPENFLTKFVGWLINSGKTNPDLTPEVYAIASLLQSLVTNKRTGFQALMTSIVYGLSPSRELVDLYNKFGFGISYQDIKSLLASWNKAEAENGSCPSEIANKYPAVDVMDNDDFKMDTLTGASETNHRTNVMFVQNENLIEHNVSDAIAPTLINPKGLKDLVKELNKVNPCKTTINGDPTIRERFSIESTDTTDIRVEQMIHSLTRISAAGDNIPPESQMIGSFAGFQASMSDEVMKGKPYYWLTFPKNLHKSVTHEIMTHLLNIIEEKNIPFVLLTDDQPVYTLIVQLRNKNKDKFNKIIPILGPFDTQVAFITPFAKRFEGSALSDIFVSASIIAGKPVDQAMRGKHFRRIVRALQLTYEALQRRIIRKSLDEGIECPKSLHDKIDELRTENADMLTIYSCIKQDPNVLDFLEKCYASIGSTPMAEYWLSFINTW